MKVFFTTLTLTVVTLGAFAFAVSLTSCTFTVSSDGSKSGSIDGGQFLQALEIYSTK